MSRKKQKKIRPGWYGSLRAVSGGVAAAAAAGAAVLVLGALVMSLVDLPRFFLTAFALVSLVAAGGLGGFLAAKTVREHGLRIGIATGIALSILLLLVSGIVFGNVEWPFLSKVLVVVTAAAVGGVLGVNTRKKYR